MPSNSRFRTRWMGALDVYRALPFRNTTRGLDRERPISVPRAQAMFWYRVWNQLTLSVTLTIDPALSFAGLTNYATTWSLKRGDGTLTERDILRPGLKDDVVTPMAVPMCFDWSGVKAIDEPID